MASIPDDAQHIIECGTESCGRYGALYCNSCYRPLCEQCRDDHLKSPDNEDHDVVLYLSKNHKIPVEKCKSHPTKDLDLLCEECQIPLCSLCTTLEKHKRHGFVNLEKFYSENYHYCLDKLPSIQEYFLPRSKELQKEIQKDAKEIERIMENIRGKVKTDIESLKKLADEVMSEIMVEVDKEAEKLLDEIKSQDKTVDEYITYLQQLDEEIRGYLSASNVTNIIIEHSKKLEIRPIPETTKPVAPTYTAGQYSKEDVSNLLGKLHVDQTKPELRSIKALESCTSTSKEVKGEYPKASNVQQTESPSASVIKVRELTVPGVERLFHLSIDTAEKVWASDNSGNLVQTDLQGNMLQEINTSRQGVGYHTVTENADLIYADRENKVIYKKSMDLKEVSPFMRILDWEPISINSSHKNGGIFVGMKKTTGARNSDAKVVKYSKYGSYLHSIHRDNNRNLYSEPHYITENINGDICTSDSGKQEVVVVNEAGQHRFSYRGQRSPFNPYGICTDTLGHIIVCDGYFNNGTIDIIDTDGEFLTHLVSQPGINRPYSVCVDDKNNLYVGYCSSNTLNVYKYLQ
nr:E3 ubiquitin-protein ligase TRIM71-like isoform X1 [Crassostrea gigas]XP_011419141.2 E3 ubiquitin-protein ligase TRIM71-like isoform X1 [Crassostrea gigas]